VETGYEGWTGKILDPFHDTDSEREYAYDAKTKSTGKLVEALKEAPKRGWLVVDMKEDWNTIFRPESR